MITTLAVVVTSCRSDVDVTRQPDVKGTDVVNAVVDLIKAKCVFPEDRLFLRRLAFVESTDGNDPDTYRQGYDGGIWKVSQSMLSATTSCPTVIRNTCQTIQDELNIDWTAVTWADLRKPLYSGLAAALYLMTRLGSSTPDVPATLEGQEKLWLQQYHPGSPHRDFASYVVNATVYECKDPMDVAFIVDSSGSINDGDFNLSLGFVANVVNALDVPDVARIALVIFDSMTNVEMTFNSHVSKADIVSAIRTYNRISAGSTNTALALSTTRTSVFSASAGARSNVKRVAVLITDGQSDVPSTTASQAERLRSESGVVTFAIGVGGYDLAELHAIASDPKCSHTYTLPGFPAIQSIINEIKRSTCKAAIYVVPDKTVTLPTGTSTVTTTGGHGGVEVNVSCGIAHIYLSYTNPNPNSAMYSQMFTATDDHPAYLTFLASSSDQPVYMTVVGSNLPPNVAALRNCSEFSATITHTKEAVIKCQVNNECTECTDEQIKQNSRIRELINCNDFSRLELSNPCTLEGVQAGQVLFPYPYSPNMFIRCDYKARPYVTLCPDQMTFDARTLTCGFGSSSGGNRVPLPSSFPNPCTPAHIQAEYLYFQYNPDKSMFIHCDLWGNAWLEQCPVLEIWDQKLLTCVFERPGGNHPTSTQATITNPCTPQAIAAGQMFHPYPCDHTRFIHCGADGNFWVQFCPGGMFYDPQAYICVVGDPQQGHHGCD